MFVISVVRNQFLDVNDVRLERRKEQMDMKTILYWTTTIFIALETFAGGIVDLIHGRTGIFGGPRVTGVVTGLGYPVYVLTIIGICKIPGAIAVVLPVFLRLKEWAYAGIVFELAGAAVSQAVCGHRSELVVPLVLLGVALASWGLRPPNRILGGTLIPHGRGTVTPLGSTRAA
jgi:uncharacterized membrane protein YphA (DoxX/SURF4 family)